jgi:hypothetical protein
MREEADWKTISSSSLWSSMGGGWKQSMKSGTSASREPVEGGGGTDEQLHPPERLAGLCVHGGVVGEAVDGHAEELLESDDALLDDEGCGAQRDQPLLGEGDVLSTMRGQGRREKEGPWCSGSS